MGTVREQAVRGQVRMPPILTATEHAREINRVPRPQNPKLKRRHTGKAAADRFRVNAWVGLCWRLLVVLACERLQVLDFAQRQQRDGRC